jgi:GNAT superfamily N-acetyltransferase
MGATTDDEWADRCATALGEALALFLSRSGRGSGVEGDVHWFAGPPGIPFFSGAHCTGRRLDLDALDRAEEAVTRVEPVHRIDVRACVDDAMAPWAAARGYARASTPPAMVLTGPAFDAVSRRSDPRVRAAARADVPRWHEVGMEVFELPVEETRSLAPAWLADDPAWVVWIAEVGSDVVGTALGIRTGDAVGVFNVTVRPEHRGAGIGSAITAAVVAEGARRGSTWAYLQSSDEGLRVYEGLGFRTVDTWSTYLPAALAAPA